MRSNDNCQLFLFIYLVGFFNFSFKFSSVVFLLLLFGIEVFNRIYANHCQSSNYYYETLDSFSNGISFFGHRRRRHFIPSEFHTFTFLIVLLYMCIHFCLSLLLFWFYYFVTARFCYVNILVCVFFLFHRMLKMNNRMNGEEKINRL